MILFFHFILLLLFSTTQQMARTSTILLSKKICSLVIRYSAYSLLWTFIFHWQLEIYDTLNTTIDDKLLLTVDVCLKVKSKWMKNKDRIDHLSNLCNFSYIWKRKNIREMIQSWAMLLMWATHVISLSFDRSALKLLSSVALNINFF